MFGIFYSLGVEHIINIEAYDHILFIAMLVGVYRLSGWKKIIALVTAFTAGHSLSLFLSVYDIISIKSSIVELFIAITIFVTGFENLFYNENEQAGFWSVKYRIKYLVAMLFGLVHGLGFSSTLKSVMLSSDHIAIPLLGFNLGVETGQLIVVFAVLIISRYIKQLFSIRQRSWNLVLSGIGIGAALILILERMQNLGV